MADGLVDAPATVLVIDDDADLRTIYAGALHRAGYAVVAAGSGEEGLALLSSAQVGLVLCDVAMPGMSGYDVVRTLRAAAETATLPVLLITGSNDEQAVIEGLAAGADDFLGKPVRLDELVARVRAHFRTRSAWLDTVHDELRARIAVVSTLGRLRPNGDPEAMARAIIEELAERPGIAFVAVFQVSSGQRGRVLATSLAQGADTVPAAPSPQRMRYLIDLARSGPWIEDVGEPEPGEPPNAFWDSGFDVIAGAPIRSGERLVGILTMGRHREGGQRTPRRLRDILLAMVIDYAAVLGAAIGPSLSAMTEIETERRRLQRILAHQEMDIVFQPIVDLRSGAVVGYEALTRFADGVPPDARFAEARAAGMGTEFEIAAVIRAAARADALPPGVFLGINVSPEVVLTAPNRLRDALPVGRRIVVEVTEHVAIADYRAMRGVIEVLGSDVRCAVDDAGAGFASMRHILELQPAYAKLDISLVRGIHDDELRQALAAGLVYYAARSGVQLVAEGVELEAEAATLRELGVDLAQGYLFGRPMPISA